MPRLRNTATMRLFCARLERFLGAGEAVQISEAEAKDLESNPVFVVEQEPSATPQRTEGKRGGRRAEQTSAPRRETRG